MKKEQKIPRSHREKITLEKKLREKHIHLALDAMRTCLDREQEVELKMLLLKAIQEVEKIWSI